MVRGALFKRIEEEKGLGGLAPAPGRGIRTVLISDSAISDPARLREAVQRVPSPRTGPAVTR